jgi:thiamine-monophosphate kinase
MARRNSPGEFTAIARLFAPLALQRGAFGLRDDAAIVPSRAGTDLVVTKDAIVEGVHFLSSDPPDLVARKLLRVNVSDLAAKGAKPAGYFLATAYPKGRAASYATAFARGLAKDQATYRLSLYGGDTVTTPGPAAFSCTMFGYAPRGRMIRRTGAKPGDDVWVTGTIGDSGAGLALFQAGTDDRSADAVWLMRRYQLPDPPAAFGTELPGLASAGIDVSDGLIQDAGHLANISGVGVAIYLSEVPLSPQLVRLRGDSKATRTMAVQAGDDYQILFAAPIRKRAFIEALARKHIVRATRVGVAVAGGEVQVLDAGGRPVQLKRAGYTHF